MGASLIPLAIALRIMKEVGFKTVGVLAASLLTLGLAGVILGKAKSTMIQGALAIAALGASLIPLAFALNLVKDVGFKSILGLAAALVTFGLAAALIGMPAVLPFILLGSLGIAALGVALIPLAFALNLATPAIEAFGGVVSAVGQSISDVLHTFIEFGDPKIGVGLLSAAIGIGAVTVALIAFSAASAAMKIGGAAAGLVSGVMGFFTGGAPPSAIEMLALFAEFGKSAPLLEQAANAITKLADALKYFSGIKEIPTGNLEALSKVGEAASKIPASSTGSEAGSGASSTSGGAVGSGAGGAVASGGAGGAVASGGAGGAVASGGAVGAKDNKDKAAKIESAKAKGASYKTPDFNKIADESDEDIEKRIKKENPNLDDESLDFKIDQAQHTKKLAAYGLQYGEAVNGEVINPDTGTPFAFGGLGVNGALKILEDGGQPTGSMFDGVVYGKDADSNQKNESSAGQVGNQNPQSAPPSLSMASGAASESSLLSSTPTTPSTASAPPSTPSKEPVKGLFQSGRDWLTSKLFGSSETKTAETPTAIATPAPSQQQAQPKSEAKTAPLQRKTSDGAGGTKAGGASSKTSDFNKLADESEGDIEKRIEKEYPNAKPLTLEIKTEEAIYKKELAAYGLTSGEITADGKVLNSKGEFVASVGDYLFGKNAKKKSSKTAGPEGQINPSSSAVPSAKKGYVEGKRNENDNLVDNNGVELSDKKLMDKFKITPSGNSSLDSEQLQRAKNSDRLQYQFNAITSEETAGAIGMITPSPNTDVGKQVAATQTARAELDAAQSANAASQSKGNTTVQTNIGGAKSNTVNVNNRGDGVRDTRSTLEVARKESR